MTQRRVLVVCGGPDAEHDVSLSSADEVCAAIDDVPALCAARFDLPRAMTDADLERLGQAVRETSIDVIFPVLHGTWGEGGGAQTVFELLGVPYVGAAPPAAALGMNKARMKAHMEREGWPTPASAVIEPGMPLAITPPLVLKPVNDGSSLDLAICRTPSEVTAARERLHPRRGALLAERYVNGRELTVGIVDGAALPIIEIVPAVEFYDYDAKYDRDDTQYRFDPDVPDDVLAHMIELALASWRLCGARDVARADIMLDGDGPWFLEINTMPGFTSHSLVPMAAAKAGIQLPELCAKLVDLACARRARKQPSPIFMPARPPRRWT